jgi:hypothetical protein
LNVVANPLINIARQADRRDASIDQRAVPCRAAGEHVADVE